eukprot:TRINITY_DN20734_c0_g1_i2.p1 TRINITY_DN20734_c0_g1~~TRINITY_DN20734_c0_g1_i2.p1  ORF type:complete len:1003 (-),score=135.08 TRINITY_DN20734_c0_g1_i2:291-3299(-)
MEHVANAERGGPIEEKQTGRPTAASPANADTSGGHVTAALPRWRNRLPDGGKEEGGEEAFSSKPGEAEQIGFSNQAAGTFTDLETERTARTESSLAAGERASEASAGSGEEADADADKAPKTAKERKIRASNYSAEVLVADHGSLRFNKDEGLRGMIRQKSDRERMKAFVKTTCIAELLRLHTTSVHEIMLLSWEMDLLHDRYDFGLRAVQVLCWRRSNLEVACAFMLLSFGYRAYNLFWNVLYKTYLEHQEGIIFGTAMGAYARYWDLAVLMETIFQSCTVAVLAAGCIAVGFSARSWVTFHKSARLGAVAYIVTYGVPYIVLLCMPFRHGVDVQGVRHHLCTDLIDGAPNITTWMPLVLLDEPLMKSALPPEARSLLKAAGTGGLRAEVARFGLDLPEDICSMTAKQIEALIVTYVEQSGRLVDDASVTNTSDIRRSCPAANMTLALRQVIGNVKIPSIEDLNVQVDPLALSEKGLERVRGICSTAPCHTCSGDVCFKQLPMMQSATVMAAAGGLAAMKNMADQPLLAEGLSLALQNYGFPQSVADLCAGCFEELPLSEEERALIDYTVSLSCNNLCVPLWGAEASSVLLPTTYTASMAAADMRRVHEAYQHSVAAAQLVLHASQVSVMADVCVTRGELAALNLLLTFLSATEHWQLYAGMKAGGRALLTLMPVQFAMMMGALKGALCVKDIIPYSRVPGAAAASAVTFSMAFLCLQIILLQSVLGDVLTLLAWLAFICANLCYLPIEYCGLYKHPWKFLPPLSHEQAPKAIERRVTISFFCYIVFLIMVLFWIYWRGIDLVVNFKDLGLLDTTLDDLKSALGEAAFWKFFFGKVVDICCTMYGASKMSGVFFSDMVLALVLILDECDVKAGIDGDTGVQAERKRQKKLFEELHVALAVEPQDLRSMDSTYTGTRTYNGIFSNRFTNAMSWFRSGDRNFQASMTNAIAAFRARRWGFWWRRSSQGSAVDSQPTYDESYSCKLTSIEVDREGRRPGAIDRE